MPKWLDAQSVNWPSTKPRIVGGNMQDDRGGPGAGQCSRDLSPDVEVLANARHDHLSAAFQAIQNEFDSTYEGVIQPLADALINDTPSPMSYSNLVAEGLSDAIKAEDALVATYPLNVKTVEIVESKNTFKTRHADKPE